MRLSETATEVMRSPEYIEAQDYIRSKSKLGETALKMVWAKRYAVSKAIDIHRSKQESQYETKSRYETDEDRNLKLIQSMPYWLNAQYKLDNHKSDMSHEEIKECKETVTRFNKIIRTMINEEQCSSMKETMDSINKVMSMLNYDYREMNYAEQSFNAVLQGMRHEIAAESALNWTPGVELADMTSIEDDLNGGDIHVDYVDDQGERFEFNIDIKATKISAYKAKERNRRPGYYVVCSGFDDDDFCGRVLPEDRTIKSKCPYFSQQIKEIVAAERQRRSKAQRTPRRAV
jgi:hypothetical protein